MKPNIKPIVKKSVPKWIYPAAALCVVVTVCLSILINSFSTQKEAEYAALNYIDEKYCSTFGDEVDFVEKNSRNNYTISCDVNQDYDLWKSTGTVKLTVYKNAGEWAVDVVEENIEYLFESNDNWYYITASGNREFLIKMIAFNDSKVTLEYYGYDMGSYGGPDDYDHETTTCDLKYDGPNRCFTFKFMGDWRINGSYIGYNRFEVGANYEYYQSSSGEFKTLKPANPDDYWWFADAQRQTGYYGSNETVASNTAGVGDTIMLGRYEIDNNESNGADSIVWRVIDKEDDKLLVISEYCLFCQDAYSGDYLTWEYSPTRFFLNGDFFERVFSTDEKEKILKTNVINDNNEKYGTNGGNNTTDYLFLLSISEVNSYFQSKEDRLAYGTLNTQKQVEQGSGAFDWWLRSPGSKSEGFNSYLQQSYVGSNGFVYEGGTLGQCYNLGIRPAMWIKIK